jgi:hypothetical protein
VNAGLRADPLVTPHEEFLALGLDAAARYAAYLGLFAEALDPSLVNAIRKATNGGFPLAGSLALPLGYRGSEPGL